MMGSGRWQSPAGAPAAADAVEEDIGGVGGPSRRPLRYGLQHRASPYGGGPISGPRRWLPRVPVASRIFPTMPRDRAAASDNDQEVHRESLEVIQERHSTEPNISAAAILPPRSVRNTFNLEGDGNPSHGNGLADIENIIKQRYFSRDETLRLTEILRSRTPDLNVEDEGPPVSTAKGFETTSFSTPAKLIEDQPSWRTDIVPSSNVHDIGSSPIEIAKAFMEAQTSASVHEYKKRKFRALSHGVEDDSLTSRRKFRVLSHGVEADNSTSKVVPTDSSICWPGSVVPNYLTPQNDKGRTLPRPLPHTPYTRSVFGRSFKNSRHRDTHNNGQTQYSTPFSIGSKRIREDKQLSTSGGMMQPSSSGGQIDTFGSIPREDSAAMKNVAFNMQGSDGKSMTESRAIFGHSSGIDNISRGASVSVHPKSSETAFKILRQLDRTIPSPTSKPLGLRQTLAKRNTSVATSTQIKGPDFSIGNGNKQSSFNESGSVNLETTYGKKVQQPQRSPIAEESSEKVQRSGANSDVSEADTSQQPPKSNLTPTSVAEVLNDKNTGKGGFSFTFPIPKAPISLLEPPTPTMASPPKTLPITNEDIPKFTFGSPTTANKLVFSFNSTSSSLGAGATDPTYKFGSDNKRGLVF